MKVLSRVGGMRVGEVERDTVFLLVFHPHKPVFKDWSVNFTFARAGSQAPPATDAPQPDQDPPRAAPRPRIQLPPDIRADKYLRQAEQLVRDKDYVGARKAMEELVGIPPGEFLMGSTSRWADDDEQPVTRVWISQGFYLGKYEVTQDQWQAVMGNNPSGFKDCGGNCPVERVSWEDVQVFIGRLNARSGGGRYRLPTEAEWEYAVRAGTTTDTYAGDITKPYTGNDPVLNGIAWYRKNSDFHTYPVGQKAPNGFGLYDMLGNVWEWVGDWYGAYPGGSVTDPEGPGSGSDQVLRGGSWGRYAKFCRSASRFRRLPGGGNQLGFRLLREE